MSKTNPISNYTSMLDYQDPRKKSPMVYFNKFAINDLGIKF